MTKFNFDLEAFGNETEAFRKAAVTGENKSNEWGRTALCGLLSGAVTADDIEADLVASLKPVLPSGKKGKTLSSLRHAKGGEAMKKAAERVFKAFEAAEKGQIAETFRPIVVAYATNSPDAPKGLTALLAVAAEQRKALKPETDEAEGEGEGEGEGEAAEQDATPLAVMAERMALRLNEATDAELAAADGPLVDLFAAIKDAANRAAAAAAATAEAA